MTDQPTTPTVDTDESTPWAYDGTCWTQAVGDGSVDLVLYDDEVEDWPVLVSLRCRLADAERARDRLRDGVQTVCAQLAQDNAMPDGMGTTFISPLLHVLRSALGASTATPGATVLWSGGPPTTSTVPPLARPVPAAPAEPGATEVERLRALLQRANTILDHVPRSGARHEAWRWQADRFMDEITTALAASPAPADEGRERVFLDMEADVLVPTMLTVADEMPLGYGWVASLLRQAAALLSEAAAPPAPAAPEERDERLPVVVVPEVRHAFELGHEVESPGLFWSDCSGCNYSDGPWESQAEAEADWLNHVAMFDPALAARPAPVTAAPTEGEAP